MIKFFRRIRRKLLLENNFSKYLIYAIGEIILVVIGILIALQVNNWNESKKEERIEQQLIELLITDLEEKRKENLSDSRVTKTILKRIQTTVDIWELNRTIDTTDLKMIIRRLAGDTYFYNENSPVYNGLSNTNLWKQLPDSLTKQIDDFYRIKLMRVKKSFEKASEYGTYCRLNFLVPNNLIDSNQNNEEIYEKVSKQDEEFISYVKLLINSVSRLNARLEDSASSIDKLIENLESYNDKIN